MAKKIQIESILKLTDVDIDPKVFSKISKAIAGIPLSLNATNTKLKETSRSMRDLASSTESVRPALDGNARAARLFLQRMTQFAILLPTFATLNKALQGSVSFLIDLEAEVKRIISLDVESLKDKFDEITKAAIGIGKEFRISALEAANSIQLFITAGFSLKEATELASASALAAKVSTLDMAEAQEFAIAATKIFGDELGSISEAFDKVIKVEDLAAVGAQDIAEAFRTGGNSLAFATKSFEDTIGLISALREQTRKSGREVGTFFKTLATRITAAGEAQNAVRGLGVEVQNLDGSLRPLTEILSDVKVKFDGLTEAEQANISKSIAGVRQFESFIATINSLDSALSLSAQASDALGTAQQKNEIIATSLSEKLVELRVAGQELALAVSGAGIGGALRQAVSAATGLLEIFTKSIKLADKLGVSLTPIITLFGGLATASVLGFGGGIRKSLSAGGAGSIGPNRPDTETLSANVANAKAAAQAAISLERFSHVTEVMRYEALSNTKQQKLFGEALTTGGRIIKNEFNNTIANVSRGFAAVMQNTAARIAIFTVGAAAAGAALNALGKATGDKEIEAGISTAASATQTGLQAMLLGGEKFGKLFGTLGFAFTALTQSVYTIKKAIDDEVAARIDLKASQQKRGLQEEFVRGGQLQGFTGEQIASTLGAGVEGRKGSQINFDAIFKKAFDGLEGSSKQFIKNFKDLKDVLFDPTLGRDTIKQLSSLEGAYFVNKDALEQLRASYDENGDSTISFQDQLNLLFTALGKAPENIDPVTGKINDFIYTLEQFQSRFTTQKIFQELQELNFVLSDAQKAPEDFANGVDRLRIEAERASIAFDVAQKNFDQFKNALVTLEAPETFGEKFKEKANEIFNEANSLARLPAGAGSIDAIATFLKKLPDDQAEFVKKYISAEQERFKAQVDASQAAQAVQVEIFDRNQKLIESEKEAAIVAQKALDEFRIGMLEFGGDAQAAMSNIDKFINMTDVEKAQMELQNVSAAAAIKVSSLNTQITDLDQEISKLGGAADGTEDSFKRAGLVQERSELILEKENIARQETIDSIKGRIAVGKAEQKAAEDARKEEEKRIKLLRDLEDATAEFNNKLKETESKFEEFELDRLADLAGKEADALEELKSAQQDVISATTDLDAAYSDFISAIYQVNDAIAEAEIRANTLQNEIDVLTGGISTFEGRLAGLNSAFRDVLDDANITLEQRIKLERQLAEETLSFLQQARDEIVNAGLGVFGQSSAENNDLQQGITALSFVAEQLGGSFENFLNLGTGDFAAISDQLLNLPLSLRQSILDALQALPSTANIGGFSVEQLREAIGQVGAGIAPEVGLPSLEELTSQQVEQLSILQDLALKDAQLQYAQVAAANSVVEKAEEQLDIAKIAEERAREELGIIRDSIQEEIAVLNAANAERKELTAEIIAATDRNTLRQIEEEAQLFAEQNATFREVGEQIISGIGSIISSKIALIDASAAAGAATGHIPNFAGGNLSPSEAAGILSAASREKRAMPAGAGLAVANTSEAIIPMRSRGFIPNFQNGNASPIAAGIEAIKAVNETVVAAISRSVTEALANLGGGDSNLTTEVLDNISTKLSDINSLLEEINVSNIAIQTNTSSTETTTTPTVAANTQDVNITLQTNGQTVVSVTGLDNLIEQVREGVKEAAAEQVDEQLNAVLAQLESVIQVLQERGLLSSLGQAG